MVLDVSRASIFVPRIADTSVDGACDLGAMPGLGGLTSLVISFVCLFRATPATASRLLSTGANGFTVRGIHAGNPTLAFDWGGGSLHTLTTTGGHPFTEQTFLHVVAIYDGGGVNNLARSRVWVNATVPTGTFTGTVPASLSAPSTNLYLGAGGVAGTVMSSNAFIDDLAIWRGVANPELLGIDLVRELYNRALRLDLAACSLGLPDRWYRGDGIVGANVPDLGNDGVDGTLLGAASREPWIYRRAA